MVFFLVLRNIARNKKNNIIITLLIAVITFIFFIGNSVIGRSNQSIRLAFIQSLTGDVVIQAKSDITMNLFGANTPIIDSFFTIPSLPAYDIVLDTIRAEDGISGITSQVSGKAYLDLLDVREPVLICGVDTCTYFPLFTGIQLKEGRFLSDGEFGAMITEERARRVETQSGVYPRPGEMLLLTSGGNTGFKIREVPLTGIFSYQNPGQFMNEIVIADPQTVRILNSIQTAGSSDVQIPQDAVSLLTADMDDLFSGFFSVSEENDGNEFSVDFLHDFLVSSPKTDNVSLTGGDWNFIIIRLKEKMSSSGFISSLNKKIEPFGVTAVDWRVAAGTSAILLLLIQALFNAGIFLVCVAGVITVINLMLISVFRRTREIGTLRAIGASDLYIRLLILQENFILSVISGFFGILGGIIFIRWINNMGIYIPNDLVASLLGGNILSVDIIPVTAGISFLLAVVLGIISSVYPMEVTVKIEPMEALRQG